MDSANMDLPISYTGRHMDCKALSNDTCMVNDNDPGNGRDDVDDVYWNKARDEDYRKKYFLKAGHHEQPL